MIARRSLALFVLCAACTLGLHFRARAQGAVAAAAQPSPLARALLARYPEHEIVPRSCPSGRRLYASDRLCIVDERTGLPRVVRRVSLGGDTQAAMRGADVFFSVSDFAEGARTRLTNRAWRWDVGRDAYLGLGNVVEYESNPVLEASFGILYRIRAGWFVNDGTEGRPVSVPEALDGQLDLALIGGSTFSAREGVIHRVTLEGSHVRMTPHATMPGAFLHFDWDSGVAISTSTEASAVRVHVLRLPSTTPTAIPHPAGLGRPISASRIDDSRIALVGRGGERAVLDLRAGTIAGSADEGAAAPPVPLLLANSLVSVAATASGGLWIGRTSRGWVLDAAGAAQRPRAPRAARARCRCEETTLTCARTTISIADACTDVPELDRISDSYAATSTGQRTRATLYTDDGRFRIDRLEADHVRVTRLADGARIWARMFGDALFVQADDGGYFTSDRALTDRLSIRDGRAILEAPIAPLAPRADALFRPTLVADFFAPSPVTATATSATR
jgi:hypothetical protein